MFNSLLEIWQILQHFWQNDFKVKPYSLFVAWVFILGYFNYFAGLNGNDYSLETTLYNNIYNSYGMWGASFTYFIFYSILYYSVLYVKLKSDNIDSKPSFKGIIFAIIPLIILAINSGFYIANDELLFLKNNSFDSLILSNFINNGYQFFTSTLVIVLVYIFSKTKTSAFFYGLGFDKNESFWPYLLMFLIMIPLVYIASLTKDFKEVYPSFSKSWGGGLGLSASTVFYINEAIYLLDFFNLEYLLRGLFVVGVGQYLGKHAVLPVTLLYFALHFEKPIAEALSSIFGGYILAVVALHTKSIWPGVLIHMGIAFLMEFFSIVMP